MWPLWEPPAAAHDGRAGPPYFRQWLARHIRWSVALTTLCDVLLFWDELFYYESFGLFAVLILVQLAATGAAAFRIYNKQRKG